MQYSQRIVRVFVSSTFRDMHEEREELVKRIFPQLRKLCESRGVTWGEVDLRWGVNDEQKAEGKVLPICLEEIKRCRPYFIGLLGERYGWVPDTISPEVIKREPWLAEHVHDRKSVTELEILHGVLNNPEMSNRACFYFRNPTYVDKVPAEKRDDFTEHDLQKQQKLIELKDKIRSSGLAVHENYTDPKTLGQLVLEDLTHVIIQEFPIKLIPEPLDREAAEHEAFARSRVPVEVRPGEFTGVYIGRKEYFEKLDKHAAGDGLPLVILGESGCGKSALLANWALKYRQSHSDELLIMHFIGASAYSSDWAGMVRRIMGELKRRFNIDQDIPDKPDELRQAFANWLNMAAAKGKVVLVLDALNQLEDRDQAPDLVWLPPVIPSNVRLVVSTLAGRPLDELQKRNWPVLKIDLLDTNERKELIVEYLDQYRKSLLDEQVSRIAAAQQTATPLYLRALLEELRLFGQHERLNERIDHYLSSKTIPELYEKILERYEQDYQYERPDLVREAMSLVWASRRGLSEAELLEMLGSKDSPLPQAIWSPLYLAAEQSLVNRSGLISFFHDYFREAIQHKYLSTEKEQIEFHLQLADYFEKQDIGPRKVDELPWQLSQAKSWQRLYELLADVDFFQACWNADQFEVNTYWALVERNSSFQIIEAYSKVLADPQSYHAKDTWKIASLLADTGHPSEAFRLREFLVEHYRTTDDKQNYSDCLGNQAVILKDWGRLEEAMKLHKQQETLCKELGYKAGLSRSLCNQANILKAWGQLEEAMKLHKQHEALSKVLGDKKGLSISFFNQANILDAWGQLEEAMKLHKQDEALCKELGDKKGLSMSLGNQAVILKHWGRLEEAMELHKQEEALCKELGDKAGLSASLGSQALILSDWGRLEEALQMQKQVESLYKELSNKSRVSASLGNQALILKAWGRLEEAMKLHRKEEALCKELGDKAGLSASLCNQASILYSRGRPEEAMKLFKQQEVLCKELNDKSGLSVSLCNQASILYSWGQFEEAMQLYKQQETLCKELGHKSLLSRSLGNQANILNDWGQLDEAMQLHKQEEALCKELGDKAQLSTSLCNQANILNDWGQLEEAMKLYKQQEVLCKELGDKSNLSANLGNQALILKAWGQLEEAMKLYKQQEAICKELGDQSGLSASLSGQANILYSWDRLDEAMELYKREEALCKELEDKAGLARSLINQAELLSEKTNRPKEGLSLAEEAYRIATEHQLNALAKQIKPILENIKNKVNSIDS